MDDKSSRNQKPPTDPKQAQLDQYRIQNAGEPMTTLQGKKRSQDTDIKSWHKRSIITARL